MFLINSRFPLVSATHTRSRQQVPITLKVPLLPKLRGHFAEFLNHSSPERLSILNQTTCVGFRYGPCTHIARGFSRQHRHIKHPQQTGYASRLTLRCRTDLPILRATRLHHNPLSGLDYQSVSPHRLATNDQDPTHHTPNQHQKH